MKLALVGNYGATNVGDDAIMGSILKSHPTHEWTVFSANPEETREKFLVKSAPLFPLGVRSLFKYGFRTSVRAMKSVEAVVVGGGGLFQDSHLFACFLWGWQVWWALRLGKPLFIYATGVGPLKTGLGKRITRWVYGHASGVTVRDQKSYDRLVELGVDPAKVEITADPAFLFKASEQEKTRHPHSVLISLRPWLGHNAKTIEAFATYLLKLKAEKSATFAFVSMQGVREHDHQVFDPLVKRVGGVVLAPKDFPELIELLEQAEFAIGMRYHFLIAALIARTPTLAVSYSPKVESLYEGDLAPYCVPVEGLSAEILEKRMVRLSIDYNTFKLYARSRVAQRCERASKNTGFLEGFIKTLTKARETDRLSQQ
ncbi:polysaccharide pyruvyl transferase family protein [Candidatus Peregrinibacteria bacterium]|nr:polysaccharide pyruvyl transferase family protein [Candidatus Peregrinibacteria bacterium]